MVRTVTADEFRQLVKKEAHIIITEALVPDKIIFNPPATVVYWKDGTKTVSKVAEGETFVEEVGFAACVLRKLYGCRGAYLEMIAKAYRQPKRTEEKIPFDVNEEIPF